MFGEREAGEMLLRSIVIMGEAKLASRSLGVAAGESAERSLRRPKYSLPAKA